MEPASHSTVIHAELAKRGNVCRKLAPWAGDEDEPEGMCNRKSGSWDELQRPVHKSVLITLCACGFLYVGHNLQSGL